jgi:glycine/D-amino acid oxidase-like deaminating enzyme
VLARRRRSPYPWPDGPPSDRDRRAFADAEPRPFWTARQAGSPPCPPLSEPAETDLAIVGGGLTGLWAAVLAKEDDPDRDVAVLEGESIAFGASGRNGGFIVSSLTHGISNGLARFPEEMSTLERLGRENFDGVAEALNRYEIDCDFEPVGEMTVALHSGEVDTLREEAEGLGRLGHEAELFDRERIQAEVASPIFEAGVWQRTGAGIVDPAKLCRGLQRVALELGVRVHEGTPVASLESTAAKVRLNTASGRLDAQRVLLATSAYPPLLRAAARRVVPVYEHVLMTEPLGGERLASIGWERRQGVGTLANKLHYFRLTDDNRILWGGYDAIYYYGGPVRPGLDQREASFAALSQQFFCTFPQLDGIRFTHRWGGAIDTCSRFSVFFGDAFDGRAVYALGYTGLGVGATRFGARVGLDLLAGRETEATALEFVQRKPIAFPPEPLRWAGIRFTANRMAAQDRRGGRRGLWLRLLDRLGLGFDA